MTVSVKNDHILEAGKILEMFQFHLVFTSQSEAATTDEQLSAAYKPIYSLPIYHPLDFNLPFFHPF